MLRYAYTLIEMMVVLVIIGILCALILRGFGRGVRQAEEKATIALITKLDQAMTDRVDAPMADRPVPTPAFYMAVPIIVREVDADGVIRACPGHCSIRLPSGPCCLMCSFVQTVGMRLQ